MMSTAYHRNRKERRRQKQAEWRTSVERQTAVLFGSAHKSELTLISFIGMGFFRRLWWVLTGRFDLAAASRRWLRPAESAQGSGSGTGSSSE